MLDLSLLPLFLLGALALNVTPGPDMAFTLATAVNGGKRAGIGAALGIGAGSLVWGGVAAAGLAALLAASEHALTAIRIAGGLYLLWLAIKTVRHLDAVPGAKGAPSMRAAFARGAVTNLLNPKVGIFYLAFLPAFTNAQIGPVWLQTLTLAAIFTATGVTVLVALSLGVGAAREGLIGSPGVRRTVNALAATAFGAIGLRLLLMRPG